ncbi:DUF4288 domain-containing protein [Lysobacter capsici]|uniref:DUF4288 domain-containing protein n=1 Tax=Lysobacter capsici TaxID=435897 RepID=UPI000BBACC15|nr:DUF4288 domain-containing protein [Lysobacter capsici]ATE70801.1 hypothetical protein CNO08_05130 [Lysobacter capsici]
MKNRYAARLLFQFRFSNEDKAAATIRTVEERVVVARANNAKEALAAIKKQAKSEKFTTKNSDNVTYTFEFVGVLDLLHLDIETETNGVWDEVWYDIRKMKNPMERKEKILPKEGDLNAIKEQGSAKKIKANKK